jgi:serine protease AprX
VLHRRGLASMFLAMALLIHLALGLAPPAQAARIDPALPVHPLLQYGAWAEPDRPARVLVQLDPARGDAAAVARAAGAPIEETFALIDSVALTVPQRVALDLARLPGVLAITPDAAMQRTGYAVDKLRTTYQEAIGLPEAWNGNNSAAGSGVVIAMLDTGVNPSHPAIENAKVTCLATNPKATSCRDGHGHGTHIAGIINGRDDDGHYYGVAPAAELISVKISDDVGNVTEADLLRGLEWVHDHRATRKIRVVTLSITSSVPSSYLVSPLGAAVEKLWRAGIVVVVAAGNDGAAPNAMHYAPANDPFVITVGALDHNDTPTTADDRLASFSSRGRTQEGHVKPEVVAPGRKIVAALAGPSSTLGREFADRVTDGQYLRLSGTSMAAPMVAGVVALMLDRNTALTPDQVKWLLMTTANRYPGQEDGAGVVDPTEAKNRAESKTIGRANQGLTRNTDLDAVRSTTANAQDWATAYWSTGRWATGRWATGRWNVSPID